jgi:hypothetical protein
MKKFKNYPDLAVSLLVDLKDKIGGDKVWDGHFYKTIPNYYHNLYIIKNLLSTRN